MSTIIPDGWPRNVELDAKPSFAERHPKMMGRLRVAAAVVGIGAVGVCVVVCCPIICVCAPVTGTIGVVTAPNVGTNCKSPQEDATKP